MTDLILQQGDWYGIQLASRATSIDYCYLQHEINTTSCASNKNMGWMGEIQMGKYPLFHIAEKELRYYVKVRS